jgi:hypothetical protein
MSDDLIKRSDVLSMIDAFERDFEQSWRVQFRADVDAIPEVKDERAEAAEAKLAKAAAYLQKISRHANRSCSAIAACALAELEGEPLGAEFEAVWDANKGELYEP